MTGLEVYPTSALKAEIDKREKQDAVATVRMTKLLLKKVQAAAHAENSSMNAWIIKLIQDKLDKPNQ